MPFLFVFSFWESYDLKSIRVLIWGPMVQVPVQEPEINKWTNIFYKYLLVRTPDPELAPAMRLPSWTCRSRAGALWSRAATGVPGHFRMGDYIRTLLQQLPPWSAVCSGFWTNRKEARLCGLRPQGQQQVLFGRQLPICSPGLLTWPPADADKDSWVTEASAEQPRARMKANRTGEDTWPPCYL